MLAAVATPPSDPIAQELQALRTSIDELTQRVDGLAGDNRDLRERLEHSETARRDLREQCDQLLHMLDVSRKEVRELRGEG